MFIPHHVSRVMCHMSHVTCRMSKKKLHFFSIKKTKKNLPKKLDKVVELVGGGSVINGAYPVQFYTNVINNGRKVLLRIVFLKAGNRGLGIQQSVYSNVQYIHVPICVLYSVQYSVQYILELRVRNNLQEAGWDLFLGIFFGA